MIKVHNVIPLNEIFHREKSSIHCIGSRDPRKNHTPLMYYGDVESTALTNSDLYEVLPEELEQTTFTYLLSGNLQFSREIKMILNPGSLFINQTNSEENAQKHDMFLLDPHVRFIQIRIPRRYHVYSEKEKSSYFHPGMISNYKDPIKEFKKLFWSSSDGDGESFYLWHISLVPNGRLHIPIPIVGRNFAFVFQGYGCFEENEKPVHKMNLISFESLKMGNELNIWNTSGSTVFEFLLLGSTGFKI